MARLWGVDPGDIGFVSNVAEGVSIVAESIDWREGDSIAIDANEYPSVVGPIVMRRHPGSVGPGQGMEPDRRSACVDPQHAHHRRQLCLLPDRRTRGSGRFAALADKVGALLLVDFTQASGYLLIEASVADFAFSACYKWMLGSPGSRLACWNRARQPDWRPLRLAALVRARLTRLRHDPGIEGGCDAVYPGQSGALSDLCTEQRIVVSFRLICAMYSGTCRH